jgi:uncharacterized protein YndB with AHSA1/START domain
VISRPLEIATPSALEIRMLRSFDAPRALVFEAFTRPELLRRWMFGPDGWSFESCEVDLRPGGRYRYVWLRERDGKRMGAGGTFREVVAAVRIISTERFDDAWYPGEALNTLEFSARSPGVTLVTQTLRYESQAARDAALSSGMERGIDAGYARLDAIFSASAPTGEPV